MYRWSFTIVRWRRPLRLWDTCCRHRTHPTLLSKLCTKLQASPCLRQHLWLVRDPVSGIRDSNSSALRLFAHPQTPPGNTGIGISKEGLIQNGEWKACRSLCASHPERLPRSSKHLTHSLPLIATHWPSLTLHLPLHVQFCLGMRRLCPPVST
jgi:hypothetical protein